MKDFYIINESAGSRIALATLGDLLGQYGKLPRSIGPRRLVPVVAYLSRSAWPLELGLKIAAGRLAEGARETARRAGIAKAKKDPDGSERLPPQLRRAIERMSTRSAPSSPPASSDTSQDSDG